MCNVNSITGYCDSCGCYSAQISDSKEWFCLRQEDDRLDRQQHRGEDDFPPEKELEFNH